MGYLVESAQLEDAQVFLSKYRHTVLSNVYYFLNEMYELALAIEQVHKEGLLHRDIKENNIFVFKKNPKSAAISDNYFFKIADLGHMIKVNTKYQYKLKINEKRRSWIPPEIYDSSLVEFTGRTTVDWYQYGYLLSEFADILLKKGAVNWLQLIFSPLISCLTLQNPKVRLGGEFVKEYFTMLINQEQSLAISRNEIVTTCSIKMANSTIFQLDQDDEPLRKVLTVSSGDYFFFFVRSKLNTRETLHVEFRQEKSLNQHTLISENYISKAIQPYKFAYFRQTVPFGIRSNMNLFQTQLYNPVDSLRLDTNWNMTMIQFDGDNIDNWYYINSPKEFAILCAFIYKKMKNANHDEYMDNSENSNDVISRKNSLGDFGVLSVNFQINEPVPKIKYDKLVIHRSASYKPKSRLKTEKKNYRLSSA